MSRSATRRAADRRVGDPTRCEWRRWDIIEARYTDPRRLAGVLRPLPMFALPGLIGLIVFMYLRPQEYYTFLQKAPFLYLFFAGAIGGLIIDLKLRLLRPVPSRLFWLSVIYTGWLVVVDFLKASSPIGPLTLYAMVFAMFLVISQAVQSFRAFRIVAGTVLAVGLVLALIGAHQGSAPRGCLLTSGGHLGHGQPDGRHCETVMDCLSEDAEPGADYSCERVGLMGTTAIDDRVRYRGQLQDPNELALVVVAAMPFLFGFWIRRRDTFSKILGIVGVTLILKCVINTQSRGGMLIFLAVVGVYFVRKYGIKYAVFGFFAMLPMLALGGRSGDKADASTEGRYEAWRAGLDMLAMDPIFGVGHKQFTEYHHLTAHNSYVLAFAETGVIGMFLWVSILYLTVKIPIVALRDFDNDPRAGAIRAWALSLIGMSAAYLVQMLFLSLCYHAITWVFFGLSGALYSAVKRHAPGWEVKFGLRDAAIVMACCLGFIMILPFFLRLKGF